MDGCWRKRSASVWSVWALADNTTRANSGRKPGGGKKRAWQRKGIQLLSALLYNANLPGFASGRIYQGNGKGLCTPGLNCYSCPGATAACPLGSLQSALAQVPEKLPLYLLGFFLLIGLALGRLVCGFLCPFGLIQELLYAIPSPKLPKSPWTRRLSWCKYGVLALLVLAIPLVSGLSSGLALPAFCKYICPAGTLEGALPLVILRPEYRPMLGWLFTWKVFLCFALLLLCIFAYRAFCRFLCPLGAIWSLFSRVALVGFRIDPNRCTHCNACTRHCLLDVAQVGDRECIQCGACRDHCPVNAIYFGKEKSHATIHQTAPSASTDASPGSGPGSLRRR